MVLGRVLLGYIYENPSVVSGIDAIIPMPAYGHPSSDHASRLIRQAADQDMTGLPFMVDTPLIVLQREVPKMRDNRGIHERQRVAAKLFDALHVPNQHRVRGRRIAVFDDVFTTGTTLNVVACRLRDAGAAAVYGLALARAPWR